MGITKQVPIRNNSAIKVSMVRSMTTVKKVQNQKCNKKRPTPELLALLQMQRKDPTSIKFLLPRLSFQRLVRDITYYIFSDKDIHFQSKAVEAVQEAAEDYLKSLFEDADICASYSNRDTILIKDIILAMRINGVHHYNG
jgi:histone H3/H4